jgi:hypothetical protein
VNGGAAEIATRLEALGPKAVSIYDLTLEDIFIGAVTDGTPQSGEPI